MNENTEVEVVKKKAYLVVGVIPKDTRSVAKHLQVNLEYETSMRIDVVSEQDLIYNYVDNKRFDPLCRKEWLEPIKNDIIISLLEKTESVLDNNHVSGVIIEGSFALDIDVRKTYTEILEEQGYEVIVSPVQSDMMSIVFYGWSSGTSLKSLFQLWKKYNHQFSRTYEPSEGLPTAIVVDENVTEPILGEIIQSLSSKHKILLISISPNQDAQHDFNVDKVLSGTDKIDVFWTKIVNHYNVKLVIDNDPDSVQRWHKIDVPVISLANQFALERGL